MNSVFVNKPGIAASLVIVVIVSGIFFNYISIIRQISKFLAHDNDFPAF